MTIFATFAVVRYTAQAALSHARDFATCASLSFLASDGYSTSAIVAIVSIIVLSVAMFVAISIYRGKKRTETLEKVAIAMGFTFEKDGASFFGQLNKNLHLLKLGSRGKLSNVMRGSSSAGDITLFEYHYTEGGGQEQKTHYQTVAAFHFPNVPLPEFNLGAEHWWHKLGKAFGYKLIQFETHPDFGKRYLLRGPDEDAVRKFFLPPLLDYFQSLPEKPVWSVEAAAPWLLIYIPAKLCSPDQLRPFRDYAAIIAGNAIAGAGIRRLAQF